MYQAIETKYHGPSNVKGARVSARAAGGRVILDWDHALPIVANHTAAAMALATKLDWKANYFHGVAADGRNVFVAWHGPELPVRSDSWAFVIN